MPLSFPKSQNQKICLYVTQYWIILKTDSNLTINCKSNSNNFDYILGHVADRVTKRGVFNVRLSDHHLIYWTRKISRTRRDDHKEIKLSSFKNYTVDGYEKVLGEINFPDYENFDNVNNAYSNFIQKLMNAIGKVGVYY